MNDGRFELLETCASQFWKAKPVVQELAENPHYLKSPPALLKVKLGEAAAERDGVILEKPEYQFPILSTILKCAVDNRLRRISILDFGGSLGSLYFQFRSFSRMLPEVIWSIVELPDNVTTGRELFESEELMFFESLDEFLSNQASGPNVIVLSGVLQLLDEPFELLNKLSRTTASHMVIDRTTCTALQSHRAGYHLLFDANGDLSGRVPQWFFSRNLVEAELKKDWVVMTGFESWFDGRHSSKGVDINYLGWVCMRP
jgi:putative methyltransferase (TIGR04325 family)